MSSTTSTRQHPLPPASAPTDDRRVRTVALATEMLDAQGAGRFVAPPSERTGLQMGLSDAYAVGAEAARMRFLDGWKLAGWKVGITNRRLWAEWGLDRPIVAPVYHETLFFAGDDSGSPPCVRAPLGVRATPRLEVELVFGFDGPGMGTPLWAALAVEVVDCHYEGWRLHPADAVIDFGLHAALAIGPPTMLDEMTGRTADSLRKAQVSISLDGRRLAEGRGAAALDGPANVLAELSRSLKPGTTAYLAAAPEAPSGPWIVSTGTLTPLVEARVGVRYHVECDLAPSFSLELAH